MPLIAAVRPLDDACVEVRWLAGHRGRKIEIVDLSPAINKYRVYAPLRNDHRLFESVGIGEDGQTLEWADGAIDMAATTVEHLADEQMTGADFEAFLRRNHLTRAAAAAELGRSLRCIQEYVADPKALLPRVIALACFGFEARKATGLPWSEFSLDYRFEVVNPAGE